MTEQERIQQLEALVGQLKGEVQELEAVLWQTATNLSAHTNGMALKDCSSCHQSVQQAFDLLHQRRLSLEARADLIKAYQEARAKEAQG